MTTLIVAEKPSVAGKIATAIGRAKKRRKNNALFYEVEGPEGRVYVAPGVGHVYTLREKGGKGWNLRYPVFDVEWVPSYVADKKLYYTRGYIENISELAKVCDAFVNACDYDIEGSVIGYNLLVHACGVDPKEDNVKRMHFSTVTTRDLLSAYRTMEEFDKGQTEAGLTRHVLDWYYGINLSRALTDALRRGKAGGTLSIGRVQGPALKLIVEKEREIRKFKPVPFWVIWGIFEDKEGSVRFKAVHIEEKFQEEERARGVYERVRTATEGVVAEVERREYKQPPPPPFDLTSLQIEAHRHHHISPKQTLEIAQRLYEAGYISYPRTSSQQLPPAIGYRRIVEDIKKQEAYREAAERLLSKGSLKPNNGKKTDPAHPAIYPTGEEPKDLKSGERRIYDLIVRRFLATFGEWALRESAVVLLDVGGERFKAEGKRTIEKGWHVLYGPYAKFDEVVLPKLEKGERVSMREMRMEKKMTKPPRRYTEASIVSELEKRKLGTKTTRAIIVDTLFKRRYIEGKEIRATELGMKTVEMLEKHSPEILDEGLTRDIERELEEVMAGKKSGIEVEEKAKKILIAVLERFKKERDEIGKELQESHTRDEKERSSRESLGQCPVCKSGALVVRINPKTRKRFLGCTNYPECKVTQPLPQKGRIKPAGVCPKCGYPMIEVWTKGRKPWVICTNIKCPSKRDK